MIRKGDTLYNPVTKERMTFLETAADTGGEYTLIELRAEPGAVVAAGHAHPSQTETFAILAGRLGAKVAGEKLEAGPGDVLVVNPGEPHKWWNAGDDELVLRCEIRPAQQFESLIETMFSLAADGKTSKRGMPNPLRLAVIANAHIEDVVLPKVPVWMQKAALAVGAPVGRALGFEPTYSSGDALVAMAIAPARA
jgi:quercetin dioxygenase-like cupin family protein